MGDLAGKQARNEQMRTELRALRAETEHVLANGHDALMEEKLDAEAVQLQAQLDVAQQRLEEAKINTGNGSVEDATAAMRAAAGGDSAEPTNTDAESTAPQEAPVLTPGLLVGGEAATGEEK